MIFVIVGVGQHAAAQGIVVELKRTHSGMGPQVVRGLQSGVRYLLVTVGHTGFALVVMVVT